MIEIKCHHLSLAPKTPFIAVKRWITSTDSQFILLIIDYTMKVPKLLWLQVSCKGPATSLKTYFVKHCVFAL